MKKIRLIVFGLIALLALGIVLFGNNTENNQEEASYAINWENTADAINRRNHLNNSNAGGAPQQQVVNGWTSNDWLELISEQIYLSQQSSSLNETRPDNRVPHLLTLLIIACCFEWVTKEIELKEKKVSQDLESGN